MIFTIDDLTVYFPYDQIYPEQYKYMQELKALLSGQGHCLIEMPSGSGKTIALLSLIVSYQLACRESGRNPPKLLYVSRTVPEVEKALAELGKLIEFIQKHVSMRYLGIGLASRPNLCVHPDALRSPAIDLACHRLIEAGNCDFYEQVAEYKLPDGVYTLENLHNLVGVCPYYLARRALMESDCVIYTYNYLIDPRISDIINRGIERSNTIVIFDEAHNIDNSCIEAMSVKIKRKDLDASQVMIKKIESGIAKQNTIIENINSMPGNLRKSTHFIRVLKRILEFFKTKLKSSHLTTEAPATFLQNLTELAMVDTPTLAACSKRLSMMRLTDDEELPALKKLSEFVTQCALYRTGFVVIFEPQSTTNLSPKLTLWCLDASIALKDVFSTFKNVIITSGTLSPIEIYPKILGFVPARVAEISVTLSRNSISPLIVTKGNDQMVLQGNLTTSFNLRSEPSVVRNYGSLIIELSLIVPDGLIVFFPSYLYLEELVSLWSEYGVVDQIMANKLVFVESPDPRETEMALCSYRKAVDAGRGAVLFCVARGKASEGVDFAGGYGRCVVVLGVPYQYTESVSLRKRLEFLRDEHGISESEFLHFDAMRHAAQCLGRVFRGKDDYGLMILADHRFGRGDRWRKLPRWIMECLEMGNSNLSIEMAINVSKRFFREMAQK
ncbi:General transcription and DNA repair factor IIH helicase subunit XPD [Astathelohania contejeani]|uniref:DNA 5'-3' helicase n=1 Tax=Astathelohania contejeani TaxID=164912 RepID=A0ABQ7HZI3_9MICR|nr:General transcription and DNA repair factor IIH helicase subunit XPD [Thelohania contejeani]